jgi:hypothetical protein
MALLYLGLCQLHQLPIIAAEHLPLEIKIFKKEQ